jgi:membrane fusion protein (multidrug efflux system)
LGADGQRRDATGFQVMRAPHSLAWVFATCLGWSAAQAQSSAPDSAGAAALQARSAVASLVTLERQDIRAQLMPRRYTTMAAEIAGKVSEISSPEGSTFKAGQVLIGFDCAMQQAQLEKAQAELEATEQTLRANLRLQELNSVGQLELDLSQSAARKAKAEVAANQVILAKCQVIAPFDGRVAEQRVREQQFVQAGQPLLDILDDSVLELEFLVPSVWLRWLKPGRAFNVQIDETRKTYPVRLNRIFRTHGRHERQSAAQPALRTVLCRTKRTPD